MQMLMQKAASMLTTATTDLAVDTRNKGVHRTMLCFPLGLTYIKEFSPSKEMDMYIRTYSIQQSSHHVHLIHCSAPLMELGTQ